VKVLCVGGPLDGRTVDYAGERLNAAVPGPYAGPATTRSIAEYEANIFRVRDSGGSDGDYTVYVHGRLPDVGEVLAALYRARLV
jgi:hypothetical protein